MIKCLEAILSADPMIPPTPEDVREVIEKLRELEDELAQWKREYSLINAAELKAEEEIKRLESWVDDLQSGMYINCVYCGHNYGPNAEKVFGIPMREALEEHIAICPKHPLSTAKAEISELKSLVDGVMEVVELWEPVAYAAGLWKQNWIERARKAVKS